MRTGPSVGAAARTVAAAVAVLACALTSGVCSAGAAAAGTVGGDELARPGVLVHVPAGVPGPPVPPAAGWLVADLNSGGVLAAANPHGPMATASTMKIFTALALAPRLNPRAVYIARAADAAINGTKVGIVPGSHYTIDDLLHGMIMASGNDCANALGTAVGGEPLALRLMAAQARALGARDTVPLTTSGLDAPGQRSSAYDLALAGRAALANRQLAVIMTTVHYRVPAGGAALDASRRRFDIQNHNRLLQNFPGATGVKNGYTVAAGGSFVGSATRGGHSYIAVVLRARGATWKESADLLDWAFRVGAVARPVGHLVTPAEAATLDRPAPSGPGLVAGASAALDPAPSPPSPDAAGPDLAGAAMRWATLAAITLACAAGLLRAFQRRAR